jgi:hypothetical protein
VYEEYFYPSHLTTFLIEHDVDPLNYVTRVHTNMFYNCKYSEIIVPDNVTRIEELAFSACDRLRLIHIPQSVTFIDQRAFMGCIYENIVISCKSNSVAHEFAKRVGFDVHLEE